MDVHRINVAQILPAMSKTLFIERKLLNAVAKESLLPNNNNPRRIKFVRRVSNAVSTDLHLLSFDGSLLNLTRSVLQVIGESHFR